MKVDMNMIINDMAAAGLDDVQLLAVVHFADSGDLLKSLYPDKDIEAADEVHEAIGKMLKDAPARARVAFTVERTQLGGGLSDSLWAATAARQKALARARPDELEDAEARQVNYGATAAEWRPKKRVRRDPDLATADHRKHVKWSTRLGELLAAVQAPSWGRAQSAADPAAAVAGLAGRARYETIRKRVRAIEDFVRWHSWSAGTLWPSSPERLVDYIHHRRTEGCPATFPASFRTAVVWFEERGGYTGPAALGGDALFEKNVEHATASLGPSTVAVRKAPRLPLLVVGAMECKVINAGEMFAVRVAAWARLLRVYGVLRSDDLQRLRPRDVQLRIRGLVGRLVQTKTSGAGRRVRELPLYVPKAFYVLAPTWLEVGYGLWEEVGARGRDFFLPRPTLDLESFAQMPATTGDLAALGKLVLERLRLPVLGAGTTAAEVWQEGPDKLLPSRLVQGWTGHSERATLPSAFAALGVPKADRDPLGRWRPEGSDDYVRTYRVLVGNMAAKLRAAVGDPEVWQQVEDEEAYEDAGAFAAGRGAEVPPDLREAVAQAIATAKAFFEAPDYRDSLEVQRKDRETDAAWEELAEQVAQPAGAVQPGRPEPAKAPAEELQAAPLSDDEATAQYLIVMSKRGAVLRLHRSDGCFAARQREFASYDVFATPPAANLYTSFCRSCWPRGGPRQSTPSSTSSGSGSSSSDAAE